MLTREYLYLLGERGGPLYSRDVARSGEDVICMHGAPFFTLTPPMWDYEQRITDMDAARVDMAIVSLTCPNAYFGDAEVSLQAARIVNNSMAEQQSIRPDRISWLASLPWQYELLALQELDRCMRSGAVGVMVIANISGASLTDPKFAKIWQEIDKRGLPVLVHPATPQGAREMHLDRYGLVPAIGFPMDTSLAITRMILDGFLDRYRNLKIIAAHGGGALPYLVGRLDFCHENMSAAKETISEKPSSYLRRIFYDAVLYDPSALNLCIEVAGSADRVLFGSDYPHPIGDMTGCLARVDSLPSLTARRIRGANAVKLFNL
jgi:aminocarboxymuconate-semialdehyde decarboxylase